MPKCQFCWGDTCAFVGAMWHLSSMEKRHVALLFFCRCKIWINLWRTGLSDTMGLHNYGQNWAIILTYMYIFCPFRIQPGEWFKQQVSIACWWVHRWKILSTRIAISAAYCHFSVHLLNPTWPHCWETHCPAEPNIPFEFMSICRPNDQTHQQQPMHTHAIQIAAMYSEIIILLIILPKILHPCPPMNNNIAPCPTQNPWEWAPNVGLWRPARWCVQSLKLYLAPAIGRSH